MIDIGSWWCSQRLPFVLYGMLLFFCSDAVRAADDAETLKQRFFADAPRAWEEYRSYASLFQVKTKRTVTIDGKITSVRHYEYKSNPHCKMVLTQPLLGKDLAGEVLAFNPHYAFNLKRKDNEAEWILAELVVGSSRIGPDGWADFPALCLCIHAQLYELRDLIRLADFRVVRASTVQDSGLDLCQIHFESKETDGVLLLDPNRFWTLHHSSVREKSSNQEILAIQDFELRDPAADYPILKRWLLRKEFTNGSKPGKSVAQVVEEFDVKEPSTPPEDNEFTLSAFGLPEPIGAPPLPRSRNWLWLLTAALSATGLAILFAWLKRRHTKPDSFPSKAS